MWRSEDNLLLVVSRPLTELGALHSMVGGSEQRSKAMVFGAFFSIIHLFFMGLVLLSGRNGWINQRGSQTQYPGITVVFVA
jgi:hypothetical protein